MQTIHKKLLPGAILLLAICTTLFSFSPTPGGDKFEIYLNNKLVLEEYVTQKTTGTKYLSLSPANANNKIAVYYSHCGKTGTGRKILIRDEKNRFVKQFEFADATGNDKTMSWKAKDILNLLKSKDRATLLIYVSRELPGGRLLAYVVTGNSNYARL